MTTQTAPASALQTAIGFARALVGGDAGTALAYLGSRARLLTADGTEVSGREAIGGVLTQLTAPAQRLKIRPGRTLIAGDVALCTQSWRLTPPLPPSKATSAPVPHPRPSAER